MRLSVTALMRDSAAVTANSVGGSALHQLQATKLSTITRGSD